MSSNDFEREEIERLAKIEYMVHDVHDVLHGTQAEPGMIGRMNKIEQLIGSLQVQNNLVSKLMQEILSVKDQAASMGRDIELMKSKSKWYKEWLGWIFAGAELIIHLVFR